MIIVKVITTEDTYEYKLESEEDCWFDESKCIVANGEETLYFPIHTLKLITVTQKHDVEI